MPVEALGIVYVGKKTRLEVLCNSIDGKVLSPTQ
jgi:hypothetical protein